MTAKADILELIERLPEHATYAEIVRAVELVAGIREAQEQIARDEGCTAEQILDELLKWIQPDGQTTTS